SSGANSLFSGRITGVLGERSQIGWCDGRNLISEAPPNWWTPLLSSGGSGRCRMGQGRRHFTDEFKQEAIALLVSSGRPLSQIASELGISPSMLHWRNGSGGRDARRPAPCRGDGSAPAAE